MAFFRGQLTFPLYPCPPLFIFQSSGIFSYMACAASDLAILFEHPAWNSRRQEPVLMAVPKPMLTEFVIHQGLESCVLHYMKGMWMISSWLYFLLIHKLFVYIELHTFVTNVVIFFLKKLLFLKEHNMLVITSRLEFVFKISCYKKWDFKRSIDKFLVTSLGHRFFFKCGNL